MIKEHIENKCNPLEIRQVKRFLYECSCCIDPDAYFDYAKCKNQTALESLVDVVYIRYNQRGEEIDFEEQMNRIIIKYLKCFNLFKDSEDLTSEEFNEKYGTDLEDRGMNIIKLYCVSFIRDKDGNINLDDFEDYTKRHVLCRSMHDPCACFRKHYCGPISMKFCYQ